ncbi:MAG TPA: hypothetical protein VNI34_03665 [Candidatus Nitrosotalea sp.]|nr:hypothetical protein [Candidatus Nitrosotalea sp.]
MPTDVCSRLGQLRRLLAPYWLHLYLLTYTPLLLIADGRLPYLWPQYGLGLLTLLVLVLCTSYLEPSQRRQVWLCVIVATGFEVFGSLIWGVYRYRFHNLPLYVPFGHGLVYLFGITAVGTPLMRSRGRQVAYVLLALCMAWTVSGLTWLPQLTGRLDVQGALCLPVFALVVMRSRRYALFAAIFVATTDLEIAGTLAGAWRWAAVAPWDHVPSGNPPSAIAGGYALIDGSVGLLAALLGRRWGRADTPPGSGPRARGPRLSAPNPLRRPAPTPAESDS